MDNKRWKKYLPIDKQIEKLRKKNLIISEEDVAKKILIRNSYYNLINGYKDCFLCETSKAQGIERFEDNVDFKNIYKLYSFDADLRQNILNVSLAIEEDLASTIAYVISDVYGDNHLNYLHRNKLRTGDKLKPRKKRSVTTEREDFLYRVQGKIKNINEGPLKHYKDNYENIPAWILVKSLTFGNLKMWYKLSKPTIKNKIVGTFFAKKEEEVTDDDKELFIKCLEIVNQFRNKAAHGGRTYNYCGEIELPYNGYHYDALQITQDQYNQGMGKSDLTAFIMATFALTGASAYYDMSLFRFVLTFQSDLASYIKHNKEFYPRVLKHMNIEANIMHKLIPYSAFPKNFAEMLLREELENISN